MTFNERDLQQMAAHGIAPEQAEAQLAAIKKGFPFLRLDGAATVGNGILAPSDDMRAHYIAAWENYKQQGHEVMKFVPASGAASRMFKDLFAYLEAPEDAPMSDAIQLFINHIREFPFREQLCDKCKQNVGKNIRTLLAEKDYRTIVRQLLMPEGLNYGNLPKGLLSFHASGDAVRTAMEEHLAEGAMYAASGGKVQIHFTVSHEHLPLFEQMVESKLPQYQAMYGVDYTITFSEQKPSTDTIAANPDGSPFRNEDGSLLFRPGGHGALIQNLNDLSADVVFIKNIDNVVPDRLKDVTVEYKAVIAGVLVELQKQAFAFLNILDKGTCAREELLEILNFVENSLCCKKEGVRELDDAQLQAYLYDRLHRPMRVCGMVKNLGEPGGGPFRAYNDDGSVNLQILESSQIDKTDAEAVKMFKEGTHFNPVDLVCALRDHHGKPYHLPDYVDDNTAFVSEKSKNGRELKALELPGLWNGAMSRWNTIFVEVPLITFNPVKTVNDLLRPEHQDEKKHI